MVRVQRSCNGRLASAYGERAQTGVTIAERELPGGRVLETPGQRRHIRFVIGHPGGQLTPVGRKVFQFSLKLRSQANQFDHVDRLLPATIDGRLQHSRKQVWCALLLQTLKIREPYAREPGFEISLAQEQGEPRHPRVPS